MSNILTEAEEAKWFDHVQDVISEQIGLKQQKKEEVSDELSDLMKLIANSKGDMDGVERMALRQIASMDDYRKTVAVESLERLLRMAESPYYGRVDFQHNEGESADRLYIGVFGLHGPDGQIYIHDWRAPICSLFYDYEVGPAEYDAPSGNVPGDITLKRQYKIENGEISYILDSSVAITDTILLDALAQNSTSKMRQIVRTIQREQNRIIRDDKHQVMIVQGIAGSGKTSVALHRIAYLLFKHRDSITSRNLLIFSPNKIFSDYISNVLPELGEENILQVTFDECMRSMLGGKLTLESKYDQLEYLCAHSRDAEYGRRTKAITFKASHLFLDMILHYAHRLKEEAWTFQDIVQHGMTLVSSDELEELFHDHCRGLPLKEGCKRLIDMVTIRYSESAPASLLRTEIRKMVKFPNPVTAYYALFSSPERLVEMCEGKLSIEEASPICAATKRMKQDRAVLYEDTSPILLLKGYLDGFLEDRKISHIVVDEAQDYTPVQFEILRSVFIGSSWTILGDANQLVNPCIRMDGFESLSSVFAGRKPVILKLNTSYRASHELTEFTKHMSVIPDATYATAREGSKPVVSISESASDMIEKIARDMKALRAEGCESVAVICKSAGEARDAYDRLNSLCELELLTSTDDSFRTGMVILPIYLAKGLEFDAVIVYDAGKHNYADRSEQELLYTACTRALHRLHIHCVGEPSPLLPIQNPELYESA